MSQKAELTPTEFLILEGYALNSVGTPKRVTDLSVFISEFLKVHCQALSFLPSSLVHLVASYLSPAVPLFVSHEMWQSSANLTGFAHSFLPLPDHSPHYLPHHWNDFIIEVYLDSPFLPLRWPKDEFCMLEVPITCCQKKIQDVGMAGVWVNTTKPRNEEGEEGKEEDRDPIAVMHGPPRPNSALWMWRPVLQEISRVVFEDRFLGWNFYCLFFTKVLNPDWTCPKKTCLYSKNKGKKRACEKCLTRQGTHLDESPFRESLQRGENTKDKKDKKDKKGKKWERHTSWSRVLLAGALEAGNRIADDDSVRLTASQFGREQNKASFAPLYRNFYCTKCGGWTDARMSAGTSSGTQKGEDKVVWNSGEAEEQAKAKADPKWMEKFKVCCHREEIRLCAGCGAPEELRPANHSCFSCHAIFCSETCWHRVWPWHALECRSEEQQAKKMNF